jgi:hypothetical protein
MDLILLTEVNFFFLKIDFVESISPLIEAETNFLMYNKTVKYNAKRHVIVRQNLVEILYLSAMYPVKTIKKKVTKYKNGFKRITRVRKNYGFFICNFRKEPFMFCHNSSLFEIC